MRNREIQKLYHSKNWPGTKQKIYLFQSQIRCSAKEVTVATVGYLQRQKGNIKNSLKFFSLIEGHSQPVSCIGTASISFSNVILN